MTAEIVRQSTLADLEAVIERGVQTFVEVGLALMEVRDRKLYEESGYANFDQYCHGRWGFRRDQGRRLIDAAHVAMVLDDGDEQTRPIGRVPANESQARELAPLVREDPDTAREVWRDVNESNNGHVTATKIRNAVKEHFATGTDDDDGWEPDPRIDDLRSAIRTLERCQKARNDVFTVAFRNLAGESRKVLRQMETDEGN